MLVPLLSYIPLRLWLGEYEETRHARVVGISLIISAFITLVIASILDKRSGIDLRSKSAWTDRLMESQHIFFELPIRLVGATSLLAGMVLLNV